MTGILARLVARATGEAVSGLRPHVPARFEEIGASGSEFHTLSEEVVARPPDPVQAMRPTPSGTVPGPATRTEAVEQDEPAAGDDKTLSSQPRSEERPPPSPLLPAERMTLPGPPDGTGDSHVVRTAPGTALADAASEEADGNTANVQSVDTNRQRGFSPVLTLRESGDQSDDRRRDAYQNAVTQTASSAHARQAEAMSESPDITIHIGRIELRGDSAPTRAPAVRQPKRSKSIISLSDYLKGGSQ